MPTINEIHPQAMDLADLAFSARREGDEAKAKELFLEALMLERQAALLLPPSEDSEPSRSVLFRSAASLAYNAGDLEETERLVANGLAGYPPPEIRAELMEIFERSDFNRHLHWRNDLLARLEARLEVEENMISRLEALQMTEENVLRDREAYAHRTAVGRAKIVWNYGSLVTLLTTAVGILILTTTPFKERPQPVVWRYILWVLIVNCSSLGIIHAVYYSFFPRPARSLEDKITQKTEV